MRVSIWDYQGKGSLYAEALSRDERFELVDLHKIEAILVDTDHPDAPPAPQKYRLLTNLAKHGVRIILYPHGGPPVLDYDGLRPRALPISAQFVSGEGHAEIYRRIRHRVPVHVVGWSLSPLLPRREAKTIEHLVYAPIHPWADGRTLLGQHLEANRLAYQAFLDYPCERKTVRLWGLDKAGGIERRDHTHTFIEGPPFPIPPEETIAEADAVISFGTFAYMAVAMGVSTVMYGQDLVPCSDDGRFRVFNWDRYREYLHYPASLHDASLDDLLSRDVSEWRDLFVGKPFDAQAVCDAVYALRPNRAERRARAKARQ